MSSPKDRVTRIDAELVAAAVVEGATQSRSARQQLDHWIRLGRAVSDLSSAPRRRVEAALAGRLPATELGVDEGLVFNAEIAAAIDERLATSHYGRELAAEGITTVALDDDGHLVEHRPDGSASRLSA